MRGFTPAPGQCPGPNSGNSNLFHANSFPVKQSNMHTYFCRERMCFCELGAALLHAETPLQKEHCDFASWLRHCRPRAGGVKHRQPDALHPGKTIKKKR